MICKEDDLCHNLQKTWKQTNSLKKKGHDRHGKRVLMKTPDIWKTLTAPLILLVNMIWMPTFLQRMPPVVLLIELTGDCLFLNLKWPALSSLPDYFGTHLDSKNQIVNQVLELQGFEYDAEVLLES